MIYNVTRDQGAFNDRRELSLIAGILIKNLGENHNAVEWIFVKKDRKAVIRSIVIYNVTWEQGAFNDRRGGINSRDSDKKLRRKSQCS